MLGLIISLVHRIELLDPCMRVTAYREGFTVHGEMPGDHRERLRRLPRRPHPSISACAARLGLGIRQEDLPTLKAAVMALLADLEDPHSPK